MNNSKPDSIHCDESFSRRCCRSDGGWYLIAHDLERDALRNFALLRINRIKVTTKKFERPENFVGNLGPPELLKMVRDEIEAMRG